MRRPGNYSDSSGNAYGAAQMQQHMSGQRMEVHKSGHFQGRSGSLNSDKEHQYAGGSKGEGQWRWERDGSSSHMFHEGVTGQESDASRTYYQGQRSDPRTAMEKQLKNDVRSHQPAHEEDMEIGYEDNNVSQTFEGLEQRFLDDIMKLAKDQADAEDTENARHREKISAINSKYEEQLATIRARHSNRRDEFLRKESHARQQQYQQAAMDLYPPNSGITPADPSQGSGYSALVASAPTGESHPPYDVDQYGSYRDRDRARFNNRDHGFEPRGHYPGGRVYDTGSRYY